MASDLSQLLIDQRNQVSLFIDKGIRNSNIYLPSQFNNPTGTTASQVAIVGVDSVNSDGTYNTSFWQKPFFCAQGSSTAQNFTSSGIYNIAFANPTIVSKNAGVFDPDTFALNVTNAGYYRITYTVSKNWGSSCTETNSYARLIVNGVNQANSYLSANGSTGSGVVSNSIIALVSTSLQISLQWSTDITAGSFILSSPVLTVELISPYTA